MVPPLVSSARDSSLDILLDGLPVFGVQASLLVAVVNMSGTAFDASSFSGLQVLFGHVCLASFVDPNESIEFERLGRQAFGGALPVKPI